MSQTIDIEEIKNANSNISAMALTQKWAQVFSKYALGEHEVLTDDPASSFNIFLHLTAQGAAKMMFEQAARKNEVNESTAILPKSLLHKLTSKELVGVFGYPASTTMVFCIKKSDIIDNSILEDESTGLRRLVINKRLTAIFESYPEFTLPYDVIVNAKPIQKNNETGDLVYNIYAYYDMPNISNDGMRDVYKIYNQYISSREMRYENETYIAFFLNMYQMQRKEISFYVSDPNTADTSITFDDSLVSFEVFKESSNKHEKTLMTGVVEGDPILSNNQYNYSYDYKRNAQNFNISFSKMNDNTALNVGDTISVVVYTTRGSEGNIKFPYMINSLNQLMFKYNQDVSDTYQNAMLNIVCLAFVRDSESKGGSDQLTIDQIRSKIINKKYSRDVLITSNEVKNKAKEYGLDAYKEEHDVINLCFRGIDKLTYKNMILSTGMNNFYFKFNEEKKLPGTSNSYLIEPTDVFEYDKQNKRFNYKPVKDPNGGENNLESYKQYIEKYNETDDVEAVMQASFPFYIRYENTINPKIQIYDMDVNETQFLTFTDYKEDYALDKLDISYLSIYRNPYLGYINGSSSVNKESANTYYIRFIVYTGRNTLNKMYAQCHDSDNFKNYVNSTILDEYNKQYVTFDIKMIGAATKEVYKINPVKIQVLNTESMLTDGYIAYQATIITNNFITKDKQLNMTNIRNTNNSSLLYDTLVPVDTTVKFVISGKFNDTRLNPDNMECIEYKSDYVKLVDYLTDYFGIDLDIESTIPGYETYETNIPKLYESDVYAINPNYDEKIESPDDPNHYEYEILIDEENHPIFYVFDGVSYPKFRIIHRKGDIVYKYTKLTQEDIAKGPDPYVSYYILADKINDLYVNVTDLGSFNPEIDYFTETSVLAHKKGDTKWFTKKDPNVTSESQTSELVDLPDDVAKASPNFEKHPLPLVYTGIMKNVSWINRLYFSSDIMYENIRNMYLKLVDHIGSIKSKLFDGGIIRAGLKRTSGHSNKYKAYLLSKKEFEYIKNIALKITFRVRFKNSEAIEYKKKQIVDATVRYIETLGDNNLSIDSLFEDIKAAVPDIEYINILNINDYYNGEVQTIINDTSATNEVLTVSQKITTDENGNIDFEPDITIDVVNTELD